MARMDIRDKASILIVEDLHQAQLAAQEIFDQIDCNLTIVATGAEALDELIMDNFDIIFMDIELPDINGFELTATIRSLERTSKRLPIIAVTAKSFENLAEKCQEKGFNDCLLKPLTLDNVRHMMEKYWRRISLTESYP